MTTRGPFPSRGARPRPLHRLRRVLERYPDEGQAGAPPSLSIPAAPVLGRRCRRSPTRPPFSRHLPLSLASDPWCARRCSRLLHVVAFSLMRVPTQSASPWRVPPYCPMASEAWSAWEAWPPRCGLLDEVRRPQWSAPAGLVKGKLNKIRKEILRKNEWPLHQGYLGTTNLEFIIYKGLFLQNAQATSTWQRDPHICSLIKHADTRGISVFCVSAKVVVFWNSNVKW
jgi:hypothetical protein